MWQALIGPLADLADDLFTSEEEKQAFRLKLAQADNTAIANKLQAVSAIIVAEAQSESWLTRSWRPITMMVFVAIIANNYLLYPYLSLFWDAAPELDLPEKMWDLLEIGIGGYILTRGAMQTAAAWKGNQ